MREPFFDARKNGNGDRLFLLPLSENDIVMGSHLPSVKNALVKIAREKKPRAVFLCSMCVDELLGTDYEEIARAVESITRVPVITVKMNPVCKQKSPSQEQKTYSFFNKYFLPCHSELPANNERSVNILGGYTPLSERSELPSQLSRAGYPVVNQMGELSSYDQFKRMTVASHNIVIHPRGVLLAEEMMRFMGIPYCFSPVSFGLGIIGKKYRDLERFLHTKFEIDAVRDDAERYLQENIHYFSGKNIAIGSGINGSPYELAQAFTEYGLDVRAVFSDTIYDYEWDHISWLSRNNPGLIVYRTSHPQLKDSPHEWDDIDIAIGSDAGYYCNRARIIPLPFEVQGYGYQHLKYLIGEMRGDLNPVSRVRDEDIPPVRENL
jgi:nitrogenase molybdenum-cofactor synthesis protein NifE